MDLKMDSKRYSLSFLKYLISIGFLWVIVLHPIFVLTAFKMPYALGWIHETLEKKEKISAGIQKPKLVFAAGSSTLFGVSAENLEKNLNTPTLNFGVIAWLQTDYLLHRVKKVLNPGDTIILPLEYRHYGDINSYIEDAKIFYVLTHDRSYFMSHIPFFEKIQWIYRVDPLTILQSLIDQFKFIFATGGKDGYHVENLNEYGDEISNIGAHLQSASAVSFPQDPTLKITDGLLAIKEFSDWCRERNIHLYITFPNVCYHSCFEDPGFQRYILQLKSYFRENDIKVIGEPRDSFYDLPYFYDTHYHLNQKGVKLRTEQLTRLIQKECSHLFS